LLHREPQGPDRVRFARPFAITGVYQDESANGHVPFQGDFQ
jgi:hypothetical protein